MSNPRQTALEILYETEYNGAYSNMALKHGLAKHADLSVQDKAFVTAIVYGVIKRKITLDYVIKKYSNVKIKKISKYILLILRMGIYQLMFTDKIPDSAAVDESVKLAKRYGHSSSAGYVNAVLRAVIRGKTTLKYPQDRIKRLSVKYSFPEKTLERWIEDFGYEFCRSLLEAMNKEPKNTIRVNRLKTNPEKLVYELENMGVRAQICEFYKYAVYVSGFDVAKNKLYIDGLFTAQDTAAMMTAEVLTPKENMTVMDMCAAPGGKSTHIAELMNNKGHILSCDIHEHKIQLIESNAKRLGIDIIKAECADSTVFREEYAESFDRVLADVPCSGTGIIRRKPDIRYNEDTVPKSLQYAILENATRYLKTGGELVYSTCSIDRRENEDILLEFLKEHDEFESVDFYDILPDRLKKDTAHEGYVTFYPNVDNTDGFFISKIRKKRCL